MKRGIRKVASLLNSNSRPQRGAPLSRAQPFYLDGARKLGSTVCGPPIFIEHPIM